MKTAYIVVDLGFGDAGKGGIVDYLAHTRDVSAIIRYTGGPHAAHHVVRADGVSHAFCQFGATFRPEVRSHLASGMIVKPENILYEGQALAAKGVRDPFMRLSVDPCCRVVTSYHAMLCQMKEVARGEQRHGTVGIGVGEAVLESEEAPDLALRMADLYHPRTLREKVLWHWETKQRQAQAMLQEAESSPTWDEMRAVYDSFCEQVPVEDILHRYEHFAKSVPLTLCTDREFMEQAKALSSTVVFEGAHATLLDREHGYFPYVAKTDTTTNEALNMLEQANVHGNAFVLGVVRALGYRHGPGPFVTEEARLSGVFHEKHNKPNEWQGNMRYGWFDLPAIRQGVRLNRRVDALALTMLDHLAQVSPFRVCLSYEYRGDDLQHLEEYVEFITTRTGRIKITGIKPVPTHRTDTLARLLFDCIPWDWKRFDTADEFIRFLESPDGLGIPVDILSTGPALCNKKERKPHAGRLSGL